MCTIIYYHLYLSRIVQLRLACMVLLRLQQYLISSKVVWIYFLNYILRQRNRGLSTGIVRHTGHLIRLVVSVKLPQNTP